MTRGKTISKWSPVLGKARAVWQGRWRRTGNRDVTLSQEPARPPWSSVSHQVTAGPGPRHRANVLGFPLGSGSTASRGFPALQLREVGPGLTTSS